MPGKVLIVGASGLVGAAAIDSFTAAGGWEVVAVSRRQPETESGAPFEHLAVDLRDPAACQAAFGTLGDVTHLVYTAVSETPGLMPGWRDPVNIERNGQMFRNVLDPLADAAAGLEHVSLLQGTKAYGGAVRPMRIPARERQPRVEHPNFYWLQEDYLREQATRRGWRWTIFRPQLHRRADLRRGDEPAPGHRRLRGHLPGRGTAVRVPRRRLPGVGGGRHPARRGRAGVGGHQSGGRG